MRRQIIAVCGTVAIALSSCAGTPKTIGNDRGGVIDWFGTNESEVFAAATAHCARHGRSARITSIKAHAGGHVLFDCL